MPTAITSPPRLYRRTDLVAVPQRVRNTRRWAIKDPVSLQYFHLGEEEYFLLRQFDGKAPLPDIRGRFEQRFAPQRVSESQLLAFAAKLHAQGLLLSTQPNQGNVLWERSRQQRKRQLLSMFANPLAIRLPGWKADWLIDAVYPVARVAFHPIFFMLAILVALATGLLLMGQSAEITERLPMLGEFFALHSLPLLMASLMVIKVLHELGHAVACRYFGAECSEFGVMILVMTPCLYCNVSDAWMLRGKWPRIVVSAAGVYVELVLACLAAWLWYFSAPGTLNTLCLNALVICTVGTVLFNGNPLLRYDGYFILSDFLEIPNLAEQARQAMWEPALNWFRRTPRQLPRVDGGFVTGIAYGLLSTCYRWLLVITILWGIYQVLVAYQLRVLGVALIGLCCVSLAAAPARKLWQIWKAPSRMDLDVKRVRLSIVALLAIGVSLFVIPFPCSVRVPVMIEAADARNMLAPAEGFIRDARGYDEFVYPGDVILTLEDPALQRQTLALDGEIAKLRQELANLRLQANLDPTIRSAIPTTGEALEASLTRRETLEQKRAQLCLSAPTSGVLLRPASPRRPPGDEEHPTFWTDAVLAPANRGCFVRQGDPVCVLADASQLQARAFVGQQTIDMVRLGGEVTLLPNQSLGKRLTGEVMDVSLAEAAHVPAPILRSGELAVDRNEQGISPSETTYSVLIALDDMPAYVRHGSAGIARIETSPRTIASRISRTLQQIFHFQL